MVEAVRRGKEAWPAGALPASPLLTFFFLVFLELHLRHLEVSRLGVESELEPLAYATATAMPDPSHVFNLHHLAQH